MGKKNHTRLTIKRSNKEVERKYLVEETHVLYHCSSSESKKRIEEEEEISLILKVRIYNARDQNK